MVCGTFVLATRSSRTVACALSASMCSRWAWDFQSREPFVRFGHATFVEWTRLLPQDRHGAFIDDVLDRYRQLGDRSPHQANAFTFYQMEVVLRCA